MRILPSVLLLLALTTAAQAQIPSGPGQQPGTLAPAPSVIAPPPPVAPAPVPSVVTPLPSPSYGVPPGVTSPVYSGGGIAPSIRYRQPKKRHKRRQHTSEIVFVRAI